MTEHTFELETRSLRRPRAVLLVFGLVILVGAFALGSQGVLGDVDNDTAVTIDAPATELEAEDSATATVGIEGATNGVSTYEMTLATNDTNVATLEGVTVHAEGGDGPMVHTDRSTNGSELTVTVALLDAAHSPDDAIDLFDAELAARSGGDVEVEVTEVNEITDLETEDYGIDRMEAVKISVTDPDRSAADVTISAPSGTQPGATTNATVGLEGEVNGVGSYEMTLATNDTDVATLEGATVHADGEDGPLVHTDRATDGSELTVTAALLDAVHGPNDAIELFDIELDTQAEGPVELEVTEVNEITDLDHETYEIGNRGRTELQVADDPGFLVTIDEVPEDVVAGDDATVVAEVENAGYEEATRTVELVTETGSADSAPVTLASGASERIELTWETTGDDVGQHDLVVETGDDTAETVLEVNEPPESAVFEPEITNTTSPVEGEDVVIETVVENTGDLADTQTVGLEVNGTTVDTADGVELDGGNGTDVTLVWQTEVGDHGEYNVTVTTENRSTEAAVVVREDDPGPFFDVTIDGSNEPVTAGEELLTNVTVTNVGGESGSAEIGFEVDSEIVDTASVDLEADEETTIAFSSLTDSDDPPTVNTAVVSPNVTDTMTAHVDSPEPATFGVVDVDVPAETTQGETFEANATVENVGDLEGNGSIALHFDDRSNDSVDEREFVLEGGERTETTLTYDVPSEPRAGDHGINVTVVAPDDSVSDVVVVDYGSIDSGLDALEDGGVVAIAAGEYEETVTVGTENTTFEGIDNTEETTVSPVEDAAFDIGAENVTIEGVTIDGTAAAGSGVVVRSDAATIEGNTFSELETGINLTDSDDHTIEYNTFHENVGTGISVDASDGNRIVQNVAESDNGIVFSNGAGETTVTANEITATNDAVRFEQDAGSGTVLEENNLIAGNWSVNNLAEMTVEGSANYYGEGGLEANTNGDVVDDAPADQYDGAAYELVITDVTDPATVGEDVTANVTVENTGDFAGNQDIVLEVNGTTVAVEHDVRLNAGESERVTFTLELDEAEAGDVVEFDVSSDDDDVTEAVKVLAEPLFDVSALSTPDETAPGETVQVTATIENAGSEATQGIDLLVDGDVVTTETVTLAGNSTDLEFEVTIPDDAESESTITVASADTEVEDTVEIDDTLEYELDIVDAPESVTAGDEIVINTTLENIGALEVDTELELAVDGDAVDSTAVAVDRGETETVNLTWVTTENATGERTVSVTDRNETVTTTVTVNDGGGGGGGIALPDPADNNPDDADDSKDENNSTDTDDSTDGTDDGDSSDDGDSDGSDIDDSSDDGDDTDDSTNDSSDDDDESTEESSEAPSESDDVAFEVPGFGVLSAMIAMLALVLVALSRYRHDLR